MISIILYGRNDSHGYNLPKRAALSLNCLAHVLSDTTDEIVFVDYNTPAGLPTFPESIRDTLTDEARRRLRVIRVPPAVHRERFANTTHLAVVEPLARNVGVRRSTAANRWLLSTNTDIILDPRRAGSLSEVVARLPDGFYATPRFEVPEAMWEMLDRRDPRRALASVRGWGRELHLDEVVESYDWLGFDAPGDFQLALRSQLFALGGFDERMTLGWHVDSNLSRRMFLANREIGSLEEDVGAYHCSHVRLPTVHHVSERTNDLQRFVFDVNEATLDDDAWGLADLELEEIDLVRPLPARLPQVLAAVQPPPPARPHRVDARSGSTSLTYRAPHVLPYVVDALVTLGRSARVVYVGTNHELLVPLAAVLRSLGFASRLGVLDADRGAARFPCEGEPISWNEVVEADAVVFDFGLPSAEIGETPLRDVPRRRRRAVGRVLELLDRLVSDDRARRPERTLDRRYVTVGAAYNVFERLVRRRIDCTGFQFNTRVMHGTARADGVELGAEDARELALARELFGYGAELPGPAQSLGYGLGRRLDFRLSEAAKHLGGAWSFPDGAGVWLEGDEAEVQLEVSGDAPPAPGQLVLTLEVTGLLLERETDHVHVAVCVNETPVAEWRLSSSDGHNELRRARFPARLVRHGELNRIRIQAEASHGRPALRIGSLCLDTHSPGLRPGEIVVACLGDAADGTPDRRLWEGWSWPEPHGVWSDDDRASLTLAFDGASNDACSFQARFADAYVDRMRPAVEVDVLLSGRRIGTWTFEARGEHVRSVALGRIESGREHELAFVIRSPVSPREVGASDDPRRLGICLREFAVRPGEASPNAPAHRPRRVVSGFLKRPRT